MLRQRVNSLWETVHGGPNVKWEQSLRGRMHDVENLQASARNLEAATRNIRRSQRQRLDTWLQVVLALCAVATAASPYLIAFH